jgi:hypothetical protein
MGTQTWRFRAGFAYSLCILHSSWACFCDYAIAVSPVFVHTRNLAMNFNDVGVPERIGMYHAWHDGTQQSGVGPGLY